MRTLLLATASALLMTAGAAQAQDWTGFYVGATVGYADRSESSGESVLFDTNLDGTFGDTVRTAAGADAFSTGFCGGSFNTNAAPGGCRKDDNDDYELSIRAGYDYQFAGNWVVGGVIEYSELQLQDAVTAFSITPAAYNFTRKLTDTLAVRARGGYAMGDSLFYVTGGYAQGDVEHSFRTTNTVNAFPERGGGKAKGYQLGLGYERKITQNVTLGVEFLRTSLDDDDYGVRAANNGTTAATNPFLLVNTAGTDFLRSDDDFEYNSFRVTAGWRF
ncbi:MAG: outer membrane beta-barrel protein [Phenylobacterium sp.]|uniref:outer membrane protein n=1 Tax=Phenylobacterium sp. TaxID=1871053 RepID=UPI001A475AF9|nr:outer membrane beta-barrel protein [Phenylobacterium sp.]MBL8771021.1 outer membrane beta-barrel protein [Phenylobacterium sp.]